MKLSSWPRSRARARLLVKFADGSTGARGGCSGSDALAARWGWSPAASPGNARSGPCAVPRPRPAQSQRGRSGRGRPRAGIVAQGLPARPLLAFAGPELAVSGPGARATAQQFARLIKVLQFGEPLGTTRPSVLCACPVRKARRVTGLAVLRLPGLSRSPLDSSPSFHFTSAPCANRLGARAYWALRVQGNRPLHPSGVITAFRILDLLGVQRGSVSCPRSHSFRCLRATKPEWRWYWGLERRYGPERSGGKNLK